VATKQKKPMAKTIIKAAVIIGVLIIPLMYSYFYLSAFWDPYSRLQDVSVAVVNLDKGADDYITKPFGVMELISRVKALLRRIDRVKKEDLNYGTIRIDVSRHTVQVDGNEVELTYKEYEILKYLMKNRGIVLTRDSLMEKIWGYDFEHGNRTVDVHIQSLRKKLGSAGDAIKTIRNVGYKIGD
jgi:two-component system, OmpR family, alkaline phosphatase synthesis response regulator PhoP